MTRTVASLVLTMLLALGLQTATNAAFGADGGCGAQALVTHQDATPGRVTARHAADATFGDQGNARLHGKARCRTCSQPAIFAASSQMPAAAPPGANVPIQAEPASGQADPMGPRRPPRPSSIV